MLFNRETLTVNRQFRQVFFFLVAGGIGLIVNLATTYLLTEYFGWWYLWSFCAGVLVSWTVSFSINARLTFTHHSPTLGHWVERYVLYILGYVGFFWINLGIVYGATSLLQMPYLLSITLSAMITTIGTYSMSRSLIFSTATRLPTVSRHAGAVLLALIVGALCVGPQFYFARDPAYAGIAMMGTDAEEHYVARVAQVYAGHYELSNTFLAQQDQPYTVPALGEIVVAGVGRALALSPSDAVVFGKFLFPCLASLLLYSLVYWLTLSRKAALLGTAIGLLGEQLLTTPQAWVSLIRGSSSVTSFLSFARPINPEISDLILFAALYLLYKNIYERSVPRAVEVVLLGVLTGLTLYLSPYVFTFLGTVMLIGCALFLFRRQYPQAVALGISGALGLLGALPFVYNYLQLRASPLYPAFALRQGLLYSHAPVVSLWLLLLTVALIVWPRRYAEAREFFALLIGALWIVLEQQLITGVVIQPGHYHWYITKPLAGVVFGLIIVAVTQTVISRRHVQQGIVTVALILVVYQAALIQTNSYRTTYLQALGAQRYAPLFAYLNSMPPTTVWADETTSLYLGIYTRDYVPNNPYTIYYLNPQIFYQDRLFAEYHLRGLRPKDAATTFSADKAEISQALFGMHYRTEQQGYAALPGSVVDTLTHDYRTFWEVPLTTHLKDLGVTVVVLPHEGGDKWAIIGAVPVHIGESDVYHL